MSSIAIDLGSLFERTFGYKTKAFDPEFREVTSGKAGSSRTETGAQGSSYFAADAMGNEYFMPVTLTYGTNTPATESTNSTKGQIVLSYPVIAISSRKTIIETPLTERRGTVKELINIQDYEIIIRGFIINPNNEFPEQEVTDLRNLYEMNLPVSIQCPLTDIFLLRPDRSGSDQVVIKQLKFPAMTGIKNVRPYELQLISDEPFNLITIS